MNSTVLSIENQAHRNRQLLAFESRKLCWPVHVNVCTCSGGDTHSHGCQMHVPAKSVKSRKLTSSGKRRLARAAKAVALTPVGVNSGFRPQEK